MTLEQDTKLAEEMTQFTLQQTQRPPRRGSLATYLLKTVLALLVIPFVIGDGTDGEDRRILWEKV
jgi:hypothetical protein